MSRLTVAKMIKEKLVETGYDGLYCDDCGCGIGDLAPCGEIGLGCKAAKKSTCKRCGDIWFGTIVLDICAECDDSWGGDIDPIEMRRGD